MNEADLTWCLVDKESELETIEESYYLGCYTPLNTIIDIKLQAWNNRFGQEKISDIENPILNIYFDTLEDSKLLEYCSVKIDDQPFKKIDIVSNVGSIPLNRLLSGEVNMGEQDSYNNYCSICIRFSNFEKNMKNGLKNLIVDIQYS